MGNGRVGNGASFASGDPRFIYAAHRDGSGLVLLPPGKAVEFRDFARRQLMCPVPGCPAPQITTVSGDRRHHYRHLAKDATTEHGPETWYHLEAKQVLASWARERHPFAIVEQERVLGARDRIADVFVALPGGSRYAIEVQFSSLTPELFRERHQWYRDAGIIDVWLFIHAGVNLRTEWDNTVRVTYSPTGRAIADAGLRVLWVNPQQKMVGYATSPLKVGARTYRTHPTNEGEFTTEPIDNFKLTRTGMSSDALVAVDADTAAARDATEKAKRAHAAAEGRRQEERKRRARAAEQLAARMYLDATQRAVRRAEIVARWNASPEAHDALNRFGGLVLPIWLLDDGELDLTVPGRVWKWWLVREIILPLPSGRNVTASLLLRELSRTYPREVFPVRATERELKLLLRALVHEGLLAPVAGQPGYYTIPSAAAVVERSGSELPAGKCVVCGGLLSRDISGMRVHFGECERRASKLNRR